MYEEFIAKRISTLRTNKNVSAREMSLAIGQNESYINRIENGHALPSMQCFFYICEYFDLTPEEFFNIQSKNPVECKKALKNLRELNTDQLDLIEEFVKNLKSLRKDQ
nr:helix-turn-helix transcriptional regulator [uncultured Merdimonas sp.]